MLRDAEREAGDTPHEMSQPDSGALTSELRDRLRYVEGQLEAERQAHAEARRIIAGLVERLPPAIEAPSEERGSVVTSSPESGKDTTEQEPPDRLSLWAYGLGIFLVGATDPLLQFAPSWFPGNPNTHGGFGNTATTVGPLISLGVLPDNVKMVLAFLLPLLIPICFGFIVGWRTEGPKIWRWEVTSRFWWRVVVTWLLITALSFIPWNILSGLFALGLGFPYSPITPWEVFSLSSWWIPVGIAFISSALIGNARRRRVTRQVGGAILSPTLQNSVGIAGIVLTGIFQIIAAYIGNVGTGG
jgi:hypothetical protein